MALQPFGCSAIYISAPFFYGGVIVLVNLAPIAVSWLTGPTRARLNLTGHTV